MPRFTSYLCNLHQIHSLEISASDSIDSTVLSSFQIVTLIATAANYSKILFVDWIEHFAAAVLIWLNLISSDLQLQVAAALGCFVQSEITD